MSSIEERRDAVVREALTWEGTPYHPGARVKGRKGGIDCLTFIAGVFENVGEIDKLPIPYYPRDFHMHCADEVYLNGKLDEKTQIFTPGMLHFCQDMPQPEERMPQPGDIMMWRFGLCFSHSGIVVKWPLVVHAWVDKPVSRDDADHHTMLKKVFEVRALRNTIRPRKVLTLKAWL